MAMREERGRGIPLTETERTRRHYNQYGLGPLPGRGQGQGLVGQDEEYAPEVRFNWKVAIVAAIAGAVTGFVAYLVTSVLR